VTQVLPNTEYNEHVQIYISKGERRGSALERTLTKRPKTWSDGKWGLKSLYGLSTLHLLFHPILCFY